MKPGTRLVPHRKIGHGRDWCRWCGCYSRGDRESSGQAACDATICLNCRSIVCMSHGLGRGQCPVCLFGLLVGWSGTDLRCAYAAHKNTPVVAVATERNRPVCHAHLKSTYRAKGWTVETDPHQKLNSFAWRELHPA